MGTTATVHHLAEWLPTRRCTRKCWSKIQSVSTDSNNHQPPPTPRKLLGDLGHASGFSFSLAAASCDAALRGMTCNAGGTHLGGRTFIDCWMVMPSAPSRSWPPCDFLAHLHIASRRVRRRAGWRRRLPAHKNSGVAGRGGIMSRKARVLSSHRPCSREFTAKILAKILFGYVARIGAPGWPRSLIPARSILRMAPPRKLFRGACT